MMSSSFTHAPPAFTDPQILRNLIRQEWRLCRGPVVTLAMAWLTGLWVLVIFHHPGWLIAIGLWHCITISPIQAGRDVFDGTEEFSFSLPPGRSPLYLARVSLGLVFLLANGLLGGLAIACNLPQRLWAVVFSGGLTEPFAPVAGWPWYAMAILLPCAAHAVTFAMAANARSRTAVNAAWPVGISFAVAMMATGFYLENFLWQELDGFIAGPALLVTTVLALLSGHHAYLRKEATGSGGIADNGSFSVIFWILAFVLGLTLFSSVLFWGFRATTVQSHAVEHEPARQAKPTPTPARAQP